MPVRADDYFLIKLVRTARRNGPDRPGLNPVAALRQRRAGPWPIRSRLADGRQLSWYRPSSACIRGSSNSNEKKQPSRSMIGMISTFGATLLMSNAHHVVRYFSRKEASRYLLDRYGISRSPATLATLAWRGTARSFVRTGHAARFTRISIWTHLPRRSCPSRCAPPAKPLDLTPLGQRKAPASFPKTGAATFRS